MVLQQGIAKIRFGARPILVKRFLVSIAGQSHSTVAKKDGSWSVQLDAIMEYGGPHTLTVAGNNTQTFEDVLIGEVWVCSGQSNMQWPVQQANDADLAIATADLGQIRLHFCSSGWHTRTSMELQR